MADALQSSTIRRVFAVRRMVPGVLEAWGAVEVHVDGFRAERGRPFALVSTSGANQALLELLAGAYRAEVLHIERPLDLVEVMTVRHQGLSEPVVAALLGPDAIAAHARRQRRRRRGDLARVAAALVAMGVLAAAASEVLRDPPGGRTLHGRSGEIRVP